MTHVCIVGTVSWWTSRTGCPAADLYVKQGICSRVSHVTSSAFRFAEMHDPLTLRLQRQETGCGGTQIQRGWEAIALVDLTEVCRIQLWYARLWTTLQCQSTVACTWHLGWQCLIHTSFKCWAYFLSYTINIYGEITWWFTNCYLQTARVFLTEQWVPLVRNDVNCFILTSQQYVNDWCSSFRYHHHHHHHHKIVVRQLTFASSTIIWKGSVQRCD